MTKFQTKLITTIKETKQGASCAWLAEKFWPHNALWKRQGAWRKMGGCLNQLRKAGKVYEHRGRWFAI